MTKHLKLASLSISALLLFVSAVSAQVPYPSLAFTRESNSEGSTDYVLRPKVEEIQKKAGGVDKPYQIVGVLARPAKAMAVLLFLNAQKEIQFDPQANSRVVITVDGVELPRLQYELTATTDSDVIKLQIANVMIPLKDLQRIAKGASVTLKIGSVVHQIEKDNLSALRYLTAEIEKDLAK
ncbi:MAG TPA: hypothetical protein VNO50_21175 [Pyrinomonadaceae bacterium]|nr:hypothetical protein [Pyrinomonadaceae bacterium]